MSDFSDKWERDGQWLMGRSMIRDIIDFLRDRHLEVVRDERDLCRVNISLPLPTVRDEISGKMVSVYWFVPEELRPIFEQATGETILSFEDEISRLQSGIGQTNTAFTLDSMNAELAIIEQSKQEQGFGMLWQRAAIAFGMAEGELATKEASDQRNGMVLAANQVAYLLDEFREPKPGSVEWFLANTADWSRISTTGPKLHPEEMGIEVAMRDLGITEPLQDVKTELWKAGHSFDEATGKWKERGE